MKLWLICLLILAPQFASAAREGWDNGNAGDTYAMEFILSARDLSERMKLLPDSELKNFDLNRLRGAILNTTVHSEEKLELRGYEVNAINLPEQGTIMLSRSRWRVLRAPTETQNRLNLVLHEYLGVSGYDDSQFRISARIITLLNVQNFNPNKWWNPLNPVNHVATKLVYQPEGCQLESFDFDLLRTDETLTQKSTGNCGAAYRFVQIHKNSYTAPASAQVHGTFHRYEITVFDSDRNVLGKVTYEPSWGECLLPQDGTCKLSGSIFVGGVEFTFWFLH